VYGVITQHKQFVFDNIVDSNQNNFKGILVFKKKNDAVNLADELNELSINKKTKPYSVQKFTLDDVLPMGVIIDGKWKQTI
jgi:hypothetical protein